MMDLQLMKRLSRTSSLWQAGVALLVTIVGLTSINGPTTTTPPASFSPTTTSVQQQIKKHINRTQFLDPIDCSNIPIDTEPHYSIAEFTLYNKTAVIDYAPWSSGKDGKKVFDENNGGLYHQILDVYQDEIFIDVGANIGQMAMVGLVSEVTTFAFDPLEYDIMKICSGVKETLKRGHAQTIENLYLFRALVGNESQSNVSITRPDDAFGKFEQASLFSNTIGVARKPKSYVKEYVPMIKLDEVIPPNLPIGLVKIDVQGFEWPVVQGMPLKLDYSINAVYLDSIRINFYLDSIRIKSGVTGFNSAISELRSKL
eukprot:scaffold9977_cov72-Skeletonema_dohrnii-CCMP3373.AAC.1